MSRALAISRHPPLVYASVGAAISGTLIGLVATLVSMLPVGIIAGIPNTLRYDTWIGRTAANTVTVGQTGAQTDITKGGAGYLSIGPSSANSVLSLQAGSAGGVRTQYATVDLNGIGIADAQALNASNIKGSATQQLLIQAGPGQSGKLLDAAGASELSWDGAGFRGRDGGAQITGFQLCTSSFDVASIPAGNCAVSTPTWTGCTPTAKSVPLLLQNAQPINGVMIIPSENAGTLQLYGCNVTLAAIDPPLATYKILLVESAL